jgi:hypothetical protein
MMHPPTFYAGPLQDHEVDELAGLLDLVAERLSAAGAEDLAGHVDWWALRLANATGHGQ